MTNARLRRIAFVSPNTDPESQAFWAALVQLMVDLPQAVVQQDHLLLTPVQPVDALPTTSFQVADVPTPQIVFMPAPN